MATYLVTGCAGFIGSAVAAQLLARGDRVIGVDNLNGAYDRRLKHFRLDRLRDRRGFIFHRASIDEGDQMDAILDGLERQGERLRAVVNLAARAGVRQSIAAPHLYLETNATGTLVLLEQCRRRGIDKFVLASTSSLYAGLPMPFREDAPTDRPLSPYAASKKAAEALCYSYHHLFGLDITILRYFTVYGPAGRPDMSIFRFIQWIAEGRPVKIFGDGSQSRDFTFVDDIARGTVAALEPVGFDIINLGSDRPVVLMDALRTIEDLLGKKAHCDFLPLHRADMQATWASVEKAREILGWEAETGIEAGLEAAVRWYIEQRSWACDVETGEV